LSLISGQLKKTKKKAELLCFEFELQLELKWRNEVKSNGFGFDCICALHLLLHPLSFVLYFLCICAVWRGKVTGLARVQCTRTCPIFFFFFSSFLFFHEQKNSLWCVRGYWYIYGIYGMYVSVCFVFLEHSSWHFLARLHTSVRWDTLTDLRAARLVYYMSEWCRQCCQRRAAKKLRAPVLPSLAHNG